MKRLLLIAAFAAAPLIHAKVKPAAIFSDNIVLQQQRENLPL